METVAERLAVPLAARAAAQNLPPVPAPEGPAEAPQNAVRGASDALARGETHYTDRPGIGALRGVIAERLTKRGFQVDPAHVLITCGVEEARFVIVQQALEPGAAVAAVRPGDVAGPVAIRGGRVTDLGDGAHIVFADAADGVSGNIADSVGNAGWLVLEAPNADVALDVPEALRDRTIVIGAIGAEAGLASWRVGYLACGAKAYNDLRDFKQALTICTTNLSQWAALSWLEDK